MKNKKELFYGILILCFFQMYHAQFTITNPLTTNDASGLRIGDQAYLTAARGVDANGQGYLRLNDATANQKGYFYVLQSFSSGLGLIADFEYKTWRNKDDNTYFGADGFSVFIFDGSITDANFKLGGYGGSLGYATYNNPAGTTGLSGGYIGLGFDEYGNFAQSNEGRNGGLPNFLPNSVALRGPTSANPSNPYFTSQGLGDRTGTDPAIRKRDDIDYNTTTTTRPSKDIFYRRVQVFLTKSGADYLVNVKWRKNTETTFTSILSYTIPGATYPIPATLKLGFAASTGGGFNYHEIRNILLTTPGNLRVDSRVNTSFLCKEKKTNLVFNIEVSNDSDGSISDINFTNKIADKNAVLLDNSQFKITSITTTGFMASTVPSTSNSNSISGVVSLASKTSGIIVITGDYFPNGLKTNERFTSTSTAFSSASDSDLTNNTAISEVSVRKCGLISNPSLPSRTK